MSTLADKLRPYVLAIQADAAKGNKAASETVSLYMMHCSCPSDPGAPALCEAAFGQWMKDRAREDAA